MIPSQNTDVTAALNSAYAYSEAMKAALASTCTQFALAGALRRGVFETTDAGLLVLDFVVVPEILSISDENSGNLTEKDLLVDAVEGLDECGELKLLPSFPHRERQLHQLLFPWGLVRLWVAKASTFGSVLLYRTGPQAHTSSLMEASRCHKSLWLPYSGLFNGQTTIGATEGEIYRALGIRFIAPECRGAVAETDAKTE